MADEKPITAGSADKKSHAAGPDSLTAAAVAATSPPPAPLQTALDWRPDGSAALTAAPADGRRFKPGVRHQIRDDARRTAEYLASRGKTPAEALHDVVKLGAARAIAFIVKETGCTRLQALDRWQAMTEALLPYTAPRFDVIELGAANAGGAAIGHFLAASAMSELLATRRDSPRSQEGITLDATAQGGLALQINDLGQSQNGDNSAIKAALPPKAPD